MLLYSRVIGNSVRGDQTLACKVDKISSCKVDTTPLSPLSDPPNGTPKHPTPKQIPSDQDIWSMGREIGAMLLGENKTLAKAKLVIKKP